MTARFIMQELQVLQDLFVLDQEVESVSSRDG